MVARSLRPPLGECVGVYAWPLPAPFLWGPDAASRTSTSPWPVPPPSGSGEGPAGPGRVCPGAYCGPDGGAPVVARTHARAVCVCRLRCVAFRLPPGALGLCVALSRAAPVALVWGGSARFPPWACRWPAGRSPPARVVRWGHGFGPVGSPLGRVGLGSVPAGLRPSGPGPGCWRMEAGIRQQVGARRVGVGGVALGAPVGGPQARVGERVGVAGGGLRCPRRVTGPPGCGRWHPVSVFREGPGFRWPEVFPRGSPSRFWCLSPVV